MVLVQDRFNNMYLDLQMTKMRVEKYLDVDILNPNFKSYVPCNIKDLDDKTTKALVKQFAKENNLNITPAGYGCMFPVIKYSELELKKAPSFHTVYILDGQIVSSKEIQKAYKEFYEEFFQN